MRGCQIKVTFSGASVDSRHIVEPKVFVGHVRHQSLSADPGLDTAGINRSVHLDVPDRNLRGRKAKPASAVFDRGVDGNLTGPTLETLANNPWFCPNEPILIP